MSGAPRDRDRNWFGRLACPFIKLKKSPVMIKLNVRYSKKVPANKLNGDKKNNMELQQQLYAIPLWKKIG